MHNLFSMPCCMYHMEAGKWGSDQGAFYWEYPSPGGWLSITLPSCSEPGRSQAPSPICWAAGPRILSSCPCVMIKSVIMTCIFLSQSGTWWHPVPVSGSAVLEVLAVMVHSQLMVLTFQQGLASCERKQEKHILFKKSNHIIGNGFSCVHKVCFCG